MLRVESNSKKNKQEENFPSFNFLNDQRFSFIFVQLVMSSEEVFTNEEVHLFT